MLFVTTSDLAYDLADAMKVNGWQVVWAVDCLDALTFLESASVDAATFYVDGSNIELAILLLEALRARGVPCIVMISWDEPGLRSRFEGKCEFFDDFPRFEAAVNATAAGKRAPVQLKNRKDEPENDGDLEDLWLKALAYSDGGGRVESGE
jgi:hypothetical protein